MKWRRIGEEGGGHLALFIYIHFLLMFSGLVITAVGSGDKGFKSSELRILGPAIIVTGSVLAVLR